MHTNITFDSDMTLTQAASNQIWHLHIFILPLFQNMREFETDLIYNHTLLSHGERKFTLVELC